jgi:amino acid transporter
VEHARGSALSRGLRRWDVVALVINSIIGAGIFGLPARAFALAGTYSLLAYVVSALAILLVVLCFAEVASRFTATGGPYLYARVTFGPLIGFQVGWLLWIGRVAAFASLANLFVGYLAYFLPRAAMNPGRGVAIVALVSILATVNMVGVRATTRVTNILTVGKLCPLFLLIGVGMFAVDSAAYAASAPPSLGAFAQASLLLVFAFIGFEGVVIPTAEIRDPARHLPFALFVGLAVVALVYVGIQAVCIGLVPDLARSDRPLADAGLRVLGAPGATLVATGALLSIGGILNAVLFATPRVLVAMAEQGQLPRALSVTQARSQTPIAAIALTAVCALGAALFSTFIAALTITTVVRLAVYATTCASLPVLRWRSGGGRAAFSVPGGPVVSAAAVALSVWLVSHSPWSELRLAGLAMVAGVALYPLCSRLAGRTRTVSQPEG